MSNQKLNAHEVASILFDQVFVYQIGTEWHLNSSVKSALDDIKSKFMSGPPVPKAELPAVLKQEMILPANKEEWNLRFMNFIQDAEVPARLEGSKGEVYSANKFSEAGLKAFKAALLAGAEYPVLVASTKLYYKSSTRFKKAIGNYFAQGDWRTDYKVMYEQAQQGGIEAVKDHIKNETQDVNRSQFKLG